MTIIAYLPCVKMSLSVTVSDEMHLFALFYNIYFRKSREQPKSTSIHLMDLTEHCELLSIRPYLLGNSESSTMTKTKDEIAVRVWITR